MTEDLIISSWQVLKSHSLRIVHTDALQARFSRRFFPLDKSLKKAKTTDNPLSLFAGRILTELG